MAAVSVFGRQPLRAECIGHVVAQRTDVDALDAAPRQRAQVIGRLVSGSAAVVGLGVLQRQPAEGHQQFGVRLDRTPVGRRRKGIEPAHHVRQDVERCTGAVVADAIGEAAEQVQVAMQQWSGGVQRAGAAPAIGASIDAGVAVALAHPRHFAGHQIQRMVPAHRHERLTAAWPGSGAVFQPAGPHHGLADAQRAVYRIDQRDAETRRVRIVAGRGQCGDAAVAHLRVEQPPVSEHLRPWLGGHGSSSCDRPAVRRVDGRDSAAPVSAGAGRYAYRRVTISSRRRRGVGAGSSAG
jgi:hypothetical protein